MLLADHAPGMVVRILRRVLVRASNNRTLAHGKSILAVKGELSRVVFADRITYRFENELGRSGLGGYRDDLVFIPVSTH